MFESMNDVPEPIKSFYTEVIRNEPVVDEEGKPVTTQEPYTYIDIDGNEQEGLKTVPVMQDVPYVELLERPQSATEDLLLRVAPKACITFANFVAQTEQWEFYDKYMEWLDAEPVEPSQEGYTEEEYVDAVDAYNTSMEAYKASEPVKPPLRTVDEIMESSGLSDKTRKEARDEAVSKITVEVDGMLFDGDEISQNRMARAVATGNAGDTTYWKLANNDVVLVSWEQLKQALKLAGNAQTTIWMG